MKRIFLLATIINLAVGLTQCGQPSESSDPSTSASSTVDSTHKDTIEVVKAPVVKKDSIHDQIALYIAGMMQMDRKSPFMVLQQKDYWQGFSRTFDQNWSQLKTKRLDAMKEWQDDVLAKEVNGELPLYYPFSGPDFLHANTFYPKAPSITMFALERIVDLPNFLQMDEEESKAALTEIEHALRDIYSKSYFITTHMGSDLNYKKASGVLPVLYVFMARTGQEILQVNRVTLSDSAELVPYDSIEKSGKVEGVKIVFRERGNEEELRELVYFNVDIANENLEEHPEFTSYLRSLAPTNTFVKSASYVMHWGSFTKIRDIAVEISNSIFQDDTGVRLKYLPEEEWDISLFGEYTRPIKDFPSSTYQANLKKLYEETPEKEIRNLPFSLGYHIVADKVQNHMIAKKKAAL